MESPWFFFNASNEFVCLFVYFEREREHATQEGAERGRDRISNRLHTVSIEPNTELELNEP